VMHELQHVLLQDLQPVAQLDKICRMRIQH
jgi:hypothetical protein